MEYNNEVVGQYILMIYFLFHRFTSVASIIESTLDFCGAINFSSNISFKRRRKEEQTCMWACIKKNKDYYFGKI